MPPPPSPPKPRFRVATPICCRNGVKSEPDPRASIDRKSTRLNSSHLVISYAVFCLKKKTTMLRTDFLMALTSSRLKPIIIEYALLLAYHALTPLKPVYHSKRPILLLGTLASTPYEA